MTGLRHTTVLLEEAVDALEIKSGGIYVDGTFGRGGHSKAVIEQLGEAGRLWAIDKDPQAIQTALEMQSEHANLFVYQGSFGDLVTLAKEQGFMGKLDGLLLDLGVSSPQLDDAERGFSFMQDGPLDMRMDPSTGQSAADWLNSASLEEITQVLKTYGEERFGKRIAHAVLEERKVSPINTTAHLVRIITEAIPVKEKHKHPATRSFQGIRIFINQELNDLKNCLDSVLDVLAIGGKLVVISFHSLEDRIVKRFIRDQSRGENFPRGMAVTEDMINRRMKPVGKAIKANVEEVDQNRRARSAVMRVAEKIS